MKQRTWTLLVATLLLVVSAALHWLHYCIFHDAHYLAKYVVYDLAFLPIEVLLVALIIERILARHEKAHLLQKLNMVIGTFFSEVGAQMLGDLARAVRNHDDLRARLAVDPGWTAADFKAARAAAKTFDYSIDLDKVDLPRLRRQFAERRDLLLGFLANPNLLEHERFTDLLWGVFHLMEELAARDSLDDLPETDRAHLAGDVARAYSRLAVQWLLYCEHLKRAYPYIFSLVARTHPFQASPCATVTS